MISDLEDLLDTYFVMSPHAKKTVQKAFMLRLMLVKEELNEDSEELYTLWDVLDLVEEDAVRMQKFEVAQIVKDIRDLVKD